MKGARLEERIDPGHADLRRLLRVLGPVCLVVGGLLFFSVFLSMSAGFGSPYGDPLRGFWRAPVGIVLLGAGSAMTRYGYMGAVTRYVAAENAPPLVDAMDAAGPEVAPAFGRPHRCARCDMGSAEDAHFCDDCGRTLP